jgi:hypothetical protein
MDYSRSIMEILEAHLSPTPQDAGSKRVGSSSPLDRALEGGGVEQPTNANERREAIRREFNGRRYG